MMATSANLKLQPPSGARLLSGPAILLVDDNQQNVELLEAFLVDLSARVLVARDGIEALQKAEQYRPDLIILDIMLPRLSGFEVCRRLKVDSAMRDVPILMLTALFEAEDVKLALELGANDFLSKPTGKIEFLTHVRCLLENAGDDAKPR